MRELDLDCLILGGGIAGLWTLAALRRAGYQALLLETRALGSGQTVASQGIIHGGIKYALLGKLTESSEAVAEMPQRWRGCLAGTGEIDLSRVRINTEQQLLWTTGAMVSGLAGFFASKLLRSRIAPLSREQLPPPFDRPSFDGRIYRLSEPVLDVPSLLRELTRQVTPWAVRVPSRELHVGPDRVVEVPGLRLRPRRLILTAGPGNADLLQRLGRERPLMQRRPLHMLMLRGELPSLFAHCLGASANPRLTITSHTDSGGRRVWYLGGDLAERGVTEDAGQLIRRGHAELAELLPWLDRGALDSATLRIDRAELRTADRRRPDDCVVHEHDGVITVWPTKLALAPRAADRILARVADAFAPGPSWSPERLGGFAPPPLAQPPWEEAQWS